MSTVECIQRARIVAVEGLSRDAVRVHSRPIDSDPASPVLTSFVVTRDAWEAGHFPPDPGDIIDVAVRVTLVSRRRPRGEEPA